MRPFPWNRGLDRLVPGGSWLDERGVRHACVWLSHGPWFQPLCRRLEFHLRTVDASNKAITCIACIATEAE